MSKFSAQAWGPVTGLVPPFPYTRLTGERAAVIVRTPAHAIDDPQAWGTLIMDALARPHLFEPWHLRAIFDQVQAVAYDLNHGDPTTYPHGLYDIAGAALDVYASARGYRWALDCDVCARSVLVNDLDDPCPTCGTAL